MARTVTTTFALRDNYSPGMKRAMKTTTAFAKDVQKVAKALDIANKKRLAIKATTSPAIKAINDVKKHLSGIRSAVVNIKARTENFKRDMAPVTNSVKKLSIKAWNVTIKLKDKVSAGLRSIGKLVKSAAKVATVAIGVAGAAGAYVLGKGMSLEQYKMSIGHFVGVNNPQLSASGVQAKSDKYMAWLSENAKATPFSTGDVIAAGSRAVGVTGGNTDAAQGLVRIAEDMAALQPGKTIMDALEALADAQMGEMERMKEFGFKMTSEQLTAAGGDLFKIKNANGLTILDMFGGGSAKQATTAAGKWSTIMGNLEDGLAKAGLSMLTALQPLFDLMSTNTEGIGKWFEEVGKTIGTFITTTLSDPEFLKKMTKVWEDAKAFLDSITEWVNGKSQRLNPFKNFLMAEGAKLAMNQESKLQGIVDAFNNLINSFIDGLNYIALNWGTIGPAISGLITMLPQLALAFAGFKLLSFGMTTGKALGGLFGGLGGLFGKLFGGGATPVVPIPPKTTATTPVKGGWIDSALKFLANVGIAKTLADLTLPGINAMNGNDPGLRAELDKVAAGLAAMGTKTNPWQPTDVPFPADVKTSASSWSKGEVYVKPKINPWQPAYIPDMADMWAKTGGENAHITYPAPILTPMAANTQLIPDNVFAASLTKVSAFVASLGSQVGSGLQSWVKTLLSGGSVTGTVNIKQFLIGGGGVDTRGVGPGGGIMEMQPKAAGLLHVPYDNYPALLHQGEAVLPASAAGAYREGKTGNQAPQINLTVNVDGTGRDVKALADEIMRAAVRKFSEAAFNMA